MIRLLALLAILTGFAGRVVAGELDLAAVNSAQCTGKSQHDDKIAPLTVKVQVLLDRAHFSPGEIDGKFGENVQKALRAIAEEQGLPADKPLTNEILRMLTVDGKQGVMD